MRIIFWIIYSLTEPVLPFLRRLFYSVLLTAVSMAVLVSFTDISVYLYSYLTEHNSRYGALLLSSDKKLAEITEKFREYLPGSYRLSLGISYHLNGNGAEFSEHVPAKIKAPEARSIYLTGNSLLKSRLSRHLKFIEQTGANSIVFDIKDITGFVNYRSDLKAVQKLQRNTPVPVTDLGRLTAGLKKSKIHRIARVAMFQDIRMSAAYPERRIKMKDGGYLTTGGRLIWVDPAHEKVQRYNLKLVHEVLNHDVDEIQLDYIRYPAEAGWSAAAYRDVKAYSDKTQHLSRFLRRMYALVSMYNTDLSLDVFGVVAWQEHVDIRTTGQNLKILGQTADILSPMLYPSHFGLSFARISNPADHPYHFLKTGCSKVKEIVPDHVVVRPWLQAFAWRVSRYNSAYILKQIRGARAGGAEGYLLWNAANRYLYFKDPLPLKKTASEKDARVEKNASENRT